MRVISCATATDLKAVFSFDAAVGTPENGIMSRQPTISHATCKTRILSALPSDPESGDHEEAEVKVKRQVRSTRQGMGKDLVFRGLLAAGAASLIPGSRTNT